MRIFNSTFRQVETDPSVVFMDREFKPLATFVYEQTDEKSHIINEDGEYVVIHDMEGVYMDVANIPATIFDVLKTLPSPDNGVY